MTCLAVAGLAAFVLVTDGFGLGILLSAALAVALQGLRWIGPCPGLLYALSALLAARAAWLLATARRPLVLASWRLARLVASRAFRRLVPAGLLRQARAREGRAAAGPGAATEVYGIGPGPGPSRGRAGATPPPCS
jgi:hypothetical protein